MKNLLPLLAVAALTLAGCTSGDVKDSLTESPTSETSSKVTSTSSPSASSTTMVAESTVAELNDEVPQSSMTASAVVETPPSVAQSPEPYIVECSEGTPGPTVMSDGTVQFTDYCFNLLGGPAYMEQESRSGLNPDAIPYADGGTCPAYICGYGTDENGNPNPSSGELQLMDGCEKGYIDDPQRCGAVAEKAAQYGW
ncbi:hypothetical protein ACXZ66_04360 [Corynebacterium sp. S7]